MAIWAAAGPAHTATDSRRSPAAASRHPLGRLALPLRRTIVPGIAPFSVRSDAVELHQPAAHLTELGADDRRFEHLERLGVAAQLARGVVVGGVRFARS